MRGRADLQGASRLQRIFLLLHRLHELATLVLFRSGAGPAGDRSEVATMSVILTRPSVMDEGAGVAKEKASVADAGA